MYFFPLVQQAHAIDIGRFLNRLLGLELRAQGVLFEYLVSLMEYLIEGARRERIYDEGIMTLKGARVLVDREARMKWAAKAVAEGEDGKDAPRKSFEAPVGSAQRRRHAQVRRRYGE